MSANPEFIPSGVFLWSLFVGAVTGAFFTVRIRRKLRVQGKPLTFTSISHDEYLRNDLYGALLGWVGCIVVVIGYISMRP